MHIIPEFQFAQQLFKNGAGVGTDSRISAAIMSTINDLLPAATNIPTGSDVTPARRDFGPDTEKAIANVTDLYNNQPPGSSSLVIVNETFNNDEDEQRRLDFISAINNVPPMPVSVVVFGRGTLPVTLPHHGYVVDETDLLTAGHHFGKMFSFTQRCMIIAGYLVLIHAGGNQQHTNRDLIFIKEGGEEIFRWYEYYARHSNAYYLLKELRAFYNIRSYEAKAE